MRDPCPYSLDFRLPSRLSPSGLCSHANFSSCPSVRTPPLAPTLPTHSVIKPDMPNYVGLDYTEHTPEGLSACRSSQLPMFFRLRRYQEYFADSPCRTRVYYVLGPYQSASCAPGSFSKNLLTQRARCRSRSRMPHLGPGGARSAKPRLVLRQRQLGTAWEDVTLSLDAPPALRTVLDQAVHGHHLQDWLISVSPHNHWTYRNVITVTGSLVLGVAASKRCAIVARPNLYLRAPSSITSSSTAYGSTTPHRNYSTVDRRPSERQRLLMVYPSAHVS
jgi:hypothetical protein